MMINDLLNTSNLLEVSEGIFSVLDESRQQSGYDGHVLAYDAIAGNRFFNRLFWGNWPSNYTKFCQESLSRSTQKPVLDVGCGSLVFTAAAYANSNRQQVVLLDRSLGMLKRARERLEQIRGSVCENIVFLQGDVFDLPFKDNAFGTVISHGLLHMHDSKTGILSELERVKSDDGTISVTSLVNDKGLGRRYLQKLEKSGQTGKNINSKSLDQLLTSRPLNYKRFTRGNVAYIESL